MEMKNRTRCPDCGSQDLAPADQDGWRYCNSCGSDFSPDYQQGDDPGEDD